MFFKKANNLIFFHVNFPGITLIISVYTYHTNLNFISDTKKITGFHTNSRSHLFIQPQPPNVGKTFTQNVANGRHKTPEFIDKIGQGRVWTGAEAIKIGLVDRLGNIEDAVKSAAKKAGLKEYKLVDYPDQKDPLKELFDDSADKVRTYFTKQELGENYNYYQKMQSVLKTTGIQSRMPYEVVIK